MLTRVPSHLKKSPVQTLFKSAQHLNTTAIDNRRGYFSVMDRVRDAARVPWKHVTSFFEPDGINYESQLPNTSLLHGNSAMNFNAYLAQNAIDLNTWHDMEAAQHSQFGTVDNPVLIFTSDSSWR